MVNPPIRCFFLFIGLIVLGCSPSKTSDLLLRDPEALIGAVVGASVENRPIDCFEMGVGEEVILIISSIHGNEKAGSSLVRLLMRFLNQNPALLNGKRLLLIPVSNPDGFHRHTRFNANGIDLNRNFPASNRVRKAAFGPDSMSEPETRAIIQLIEKHAPDRIISLHEPLNCIDYDGPAKAFAEYLSDYCDLPVRRIGPKPGSLGSNAGMDLNIPTVTLEFPPGVQYLTFQELWDRYGDLLIAVIHFPSDQIRSLRVVK